MAERCLQTFKNALALWVESLVSSTSSPPHSRVRVSPELGKSALNATTCGKELKRSSCSASKCLVSQYLSAENFKCSVRHGSPAKAFCSKVLKKETPAINEAAIKIVAAFRHGRKQRPRRRPHHGVASATPAAVSATVCFPPRLLQISWELTLSPLFLGEGKAKKK